MSEVRIPGGIVIKGSEVEAYKREVLEASTLVRASEAAVILACSPRTLHNLVQEGKLTGYRPGRSSRSVGLRFMAAELREYVRSMRINPNDLLE